MLTQDQIAFYKASGYLHIAGLIEAELLAGLHHETAALIERMQATAPIQPRAACVRPSSVNLCRPARIHSRERSLRLWICKTFIRSTPGRWSTPPSSCPQ